MGMGTLVFHIFAKAKSSYNRIDKISFNGNVTKDLNLINSYVVDFFSMLTLADQILISSTLKVHL